MLVAKEKVTKAKTLSADQKARIASETDNLLRNARIVKESYGTEALTLSVCCRYVKEMLGNATVSRYLAKSHPDISEELQNLTASFTTESGGDSHGSETKIERRGVNGPRRRPTDDARNLGSKSAAPDK